MKEYCRKACAADKVLILHAAEDANPSIANELFYSLVNGLSYDRMMKCKYIPLKRDDFYAYQRKCLATFRNFLLMHGKWG